MNLYSIIYANIFFFTRFGKFIFFSFNTINFLLQINHLETIRPQTCPSKTENPKKQILKLSKNREFLHLKMVKKHIPKIVN